MHELLSIVLPCVVVAMGLLWAPWRNGGAERWSVALLWTACLGVLIPHALCLVWCQPSLDDWCYGAAGKHGWWQAQVDFYQSWSGRIAATAFLTSWGLGLPSEWACRFSYPLMLIGIWLWLATALASVIRYHLPDGRPWLVTACMLTAWVVGMPARVEGLYWLAGTVTYQGGLACLLTCVACLQRKRWVWAVIPGLIAPLFSEAIAVVAVTALAMLSWRERRALPATLAASIGLALVALCPGNAGRLGVAGGLAVHPLADWIEGLLYWPNSVSWTACLPLIALGLLLPRRTGQAWWGIALGALAVATALIPQALSGLAAPRAMNPIWLLVIMGLTWSLRLGSGQMAAWSVSAFFILCELPWLAVVAWLVVALVWWMRRRIVTDARPIWALAALAVLLATPAWWTVVADACVAGPEYVSLQSARWRSVAAASPGSAVEVPRLPVDLPRTFHREDLHIDAHTWQNQGCAAFFGVSEVRAVPVRKTGNRENSSDLP